MPYPPESYTELDYYAGSRVRPCSEPRKIPPTVLAGGITDPAVLIQLAAMEANRHNLAITGIWEGISPYLLPEKRFDAACALIKALGIDIR